MIPVPYINVWRSKAPGREYAMVEQDLVLSRALVDILRIPEFADGPHLSPFPPRCR
jgi:hypothetical protein